MHVPDKIVPAHRIFNVIRVFVKVGDGQVENVSSAEYGGHQSSEVTVITKRVKMPTSFDQFFLTVLSDVGYPISYTNSTGPNRIIFTVPAVNGQQ